jgi:hypothetical protein
MISRPRRVYKLPPTAVGVGNHFAREAAGLSPLPASPPLIAPATAIDRRPGENVECPSYFHARSCGIRFRQPRQKLIPATTDIS